ncbi:uncharacterized protein PHACADRAFT_249271 [Phanerochaete carnosa HHB-10118-sp]|uniref:BHLH domain-containing protein n=1 Tax=Phanerochaete carnosa (strain HHB-10118-sp) TaxID=650164 RepID=K5X872_PHACS|nr:uncharacterized protein PHACADRAFT_249271 [Phanerochaete carnosa HHB-10118-sp]EKM59077.1 hypothetical protein PHACADRAFT_249271 [Phanerochaete carnosa HHB-10118-sp]
MEVDTQNPHQGLPKSLSGVDYQGRRPSLAGTKRKMSPDAASASSDIDPQLIGPGVPSGTNAEGEERVSKRRSSAFETHRMEYLNLQDRRGSGDGRVGTPGTGGSGSGGGGSGGGGQQQWWGSERREAASTPVFANTPVTAGGYTTTPSSAFADGSPHGRPPPSITTFAWPTANPPADPGQKAQPPQPANEASMAPNPQSPYDPNLAMLPPPGSFPHDRRMSVPAIAPENMPASPASASSRALRSRSRPTSRTRANQSAGTSTEQSPGPSNSAPEDGAGLSHLPSKESGSTPYSRSPELRVSHKLAERKRRKEMKDLFDELRDQLPADRGMKASKWEILSKAIDFIGQLKQTHQEMSREIDMLRHEVDGFRQGIPPPFGPGGPPHSVVYGHGPPVGVPQFQPGPPGPPGSTAPPPHPQHVQPPPPHTTAQQPPHSRPGSSQNAYPPGVQPHPNGTSNTSATENTS